jgi:hypothetical protein
LGVRDPKTGEREDYKVIYDAKSTKGDKIKAKEANISGVSRHRDDYKADYAVIVAVDFEGADDPESAISKEAKKHKINLFRAKDLMILVMIAAPKQLGFLDFKDLFENCHTIIETSQWIEKVKNKEIEKQPIKELLETTYKLMKEDKEPPELGSIRVSNPTLKKLSKNDLKTLVLSLQRLVGNLVSLEGEIVSIQETPEKILSCINTVVNQVSPQFYDIYMKAFES